MAKYYTLEVQVWSDITISASSKDEKACIRDWDQIWSKMV